MRAVTQTRRPKMDSSVLTAILACAGTVIGSLGGVLTSARLTNFRLKQLEEKVNKHNNLIERMAKVEQNCNDMRDRIEKIESAV
jgi:predicted nuclease with TOPRIM domain